MVSKDFVDMVGGYGLTSARILYHLPDHKSLLQAFVWQEYDVAPRFKRLRTFLAFWTRELDGPIHSVRVTHSNLIKPAEFKLVGSEIVLN